MIILDTAHNSVLQHEDSPANLPDFDKVPGGILLDVILVACPLERFDGGFFGGSGVKDQMDGAGFDVKLGHGGFLSWLWTVPCCFLLDVFFIGGLVTRLVKHGKIKGLDRRSFLGHLNQP
jgi:hypothetical protein